MLGKALYRSSSEYVWIRHHKAVPLARGRRNGSDTGADRMDLIDGVAARGGKARVVIGSFCFWEGHHDR